MKRLLLWCVVMAVLSVCGCVSQKMDEAEDPRPDLAVAQNSDGVSFISWESEVGYYYTIKYQTKPRGEWRVLRQAERVRGTGETITIKDVVGLNAPRRRYWISLEKASY